MSDTFKCTACGGSGEVTVPDNHPDFGPYEIECPTCKGTGNMVLAVEEMCTEETDCDNIDFPNCKITERHYYKSGRYKGIKSCKGFLYRPLTSDEVEELFNAAELDMLKRGTPLVTENGTVKLIPGDK